MKSSSYILTFADLLAIHRMNLELLVDMAVVVIRQDFNFRQYVSHQDIIAVLLGAPDTTTTHGMSVFLRLVVACTEDIVALFPDIDVDILVYVISLSVLSAH